MGLLLNSSAVAFLILGLPGYTSAMTGKDWNQMSELGQKSYIAGVMDAWFEESEFIEYDKFHGTSSERGIHTLNYMKCIFEKANRSAELAYGIVKNYVHDMDPVEEGNLMPSVVWGAFAKVCGAAKK